MSGRPAPAKPWERARPTTSATPGEGLPKPWESPSPSGSSTIVPTSSTGPGAMPSQQQQQQPARPWERPNNTTTLATTMAPGLATTTPAYGGYGANSMYNRSPYGGAYGPGYGGAGYGGAGYSGYGGGMYGSTGMYGSSMYGGGMYGGSGMYGGGGMYGRPMMGGGMYGGGFGGPMGPPWDPNDPNAPAPPSAWQAMLAAISGVVQFFGRLSFLVDENAHAVHFFISALLQLLDRFGSLYGELARFVLRMLGFRPKDKAAQQQQTQPQQHPSMSGQHGGYSGGPHMRGGSAGGAASTPGASFDSLWSSGGK